MRARKRAPPPFCCKRELMGTNAGWPEAFGFSVSGGAPVVIRAVEEGGSAQAAGLQPGDVIAELDGEDVQQWTLQQVKFLFFLRISSLWSSSDLYCRCCREPVALPKFHPVWWSYQEFGSSDFVEMSQEATASLCEATAPCS